MYEYRQVLVRMQMGESNRAIAEAGLMGLLITGSAVRARPEEPSFTHELFSSKLIFPTLYDSDSIMFS